MKPKNTALALLALPFLALSCANVANEPQALDAPGVVQAQGDPSPIADVIAEANAAIEVIVSRPAEERTFENSVKAVDDIQAGCFMGARMTSFMSNVSTDAAERELGRRASSDLSGWFDELYKHEGLYKVLVSFEPQLDRLEGVEKHYLEVLLRDYRRNGMGLGEEERGRLLEIDRELTELGLAFRQAIDEDETTAFFTPEESRGVPQRFLDSLPRSAGMYKVGLKGAAPSYFFGYCEVPETRQKLSLLYGLRGGTGNVDRLERMIRLRDEKSDLLGFETYAHYVTQTRMSANPENVQAFYADLRPKLREKALKDKEQFTAAKREHTGDPDAEMNSWDFSFYKNWLMKERYAVDTQVVRQYFSMDSVTQGMFEVYEELFGIRFTEITARAIEAGEPMIWHEDVRLFQVHDEANGELLGEFYTDLHPRQGKYSHAAQFPLNIRKRWLDGSLTLPRVALVCNFTKPTVTEPSLLSHGEVETYFHEFGHCLHSILTEVEYYEFAGTSVARDFVEAPSQMLENWIWNAEILGRFARHYETGEPLPDAVLQGMVAAKNLGSGLSAEGQVYLGTMDLTFHSDPTGEVDTTAVREDVYAKTRLFPVAENLHGQGSFGHLVGYQASYYGYLWSLVYAQDMFSRFEADGIMNPRTAREYRQLVLARGGTVPALQMVTEFLGREPNADAFLRSLGLD